MISNTSTVAGSMSLLVLLIALGFSPLAMAFSSQPQQPRPPARHKKVVVIGGGISGLVVGHVLQAGGHNVTLFEARDTLGGHVKSMQDPRQENDLLNIGHATHMGMFLNLRSMLRHLGVTERPVGRGPNRRPGLFRMINVSTDRGRTVQPPLEDVLSPAVWIEALTFFYFSYMDPARSLGDFLQERNGRYSDKFLNILFWSMATFEFDKRVDEAKEYAMGTARALLITQVFFKYLLCDTYEGQLPLTLDRSLLEELRSRASRVIRASKLPKDRQAALLDGLSSADKLMPLASYYTADYPLVMDKLAEGISTIHTGWEVSRVNKRHLGRGQAVDTIVVEAGKDEATMDEECDCVVFTVEPSTIERALFETDFPCHKEALRGIESGAVGVRIIHEDDLPFPYPPSGGSPVEPFDRVNASSMFAIFDISELTSVRNKSENRSRNELTEAGWLSVAYPVYKEEKWNVHNEMLENFPCADETVYAWTRATPPYVEARQRIIQLQGVDGICITGHTLTGVNKASELQIANAVKLCYESFGVVPPWDFYPIALLPDCNDEDAFYKAESPLEATKLASKSFVGSFFLVSVVSKFGSNFFY